MLLAHKFYKADSSLRKPKEIPHDIQRAAKGPRSRDVTWFENAVLTTGFHAKSIRLATPAQDAGLIGMYSSVCARAGFSPGKLLIVDTEIPNAVYLPNGTIAVTTELCKTLSPEETKAVLAHEIGHRIHKNRHVWLPFGMILGAAALAFPVILAVGDFFRPGRWQPRFENRIYKWFHSGSLIVGDFFIALGAGGALTSSQRLSLSRQNELQSDDEAARLTGQPRVVASALEKIHKRALELKREKLLEKVEEVKKNEKEFEQSMDKVYRQSGINMNTPAPSDSPRNMPVKAEQNSKTTHPSTQSRVRRLLAMRDGQNTQAAPTGFSR